MNDTNNTQNGSNPNGPAPEAGPYQQSHSDPGAHRTRGSVFDSINAAFRRGAEDARAAAEEAVPRIKAAALDATSMMAYGLSFAVSFQLAVFRKATPEPVKAAWRDGATAGAASGDRFASHFQQPNTASTVASAEVGHQTSPA